MKKLFILTLILSANLMSGIVYEFDKEADEIRFNNLIKEIRCPKCTSGSLASSNAPISEDLKLKIVDMIKQGRTDSEIKDYVSERFGKESLYDPKLSQDTYLLWFGPIIFIFIAFIIFFFRRKT
tara:strand:- start:317 stop:688 length:372 start_codon:yes stop_codon:yes gene_type:complete